MPGPQIPPAVPNFANRRHNEYAYQLPPQAPSPVYYHHPQHYHGYPQQWHPPYMVPHPAVYPRPLTPASRQPIPYGPYPYPPPQHSPMVVSSQQNTQPLARAPIPAQQPTPSPTTPSVNSHVIASTSSPATSVGVPTPPPSSSQPPAPAPVLAATTSQQSFYPRLPWLSVPEAPFPPRAPSTRRRRRPATDSTERLELPPRTPTAAKLDHDAEQPESNASALPVPSSTEAETPATSQAPSEADSTNPTTPSSTQPPSSTPKPIPTSSHVRNVTRAAVPIIPITPKAISTPTSQQKPVDSTSQQSTEKTPSGSAAQNAASMSDSQAPASPGASTSDASPASTAPAVKVPPKSWADLVRSKVSTQNAADKSSSVLGPSSTNGSSNSLAGSFAEVLQSFRVGASSKIAFLEPKGLVNTGNMCYMNSILQVLVFCIPFYDFLDQVSRRAVHNFKSHTPLLDSMIMFMREFSVIDSAVSAEKLRMRLKDNELEQYGDPVSPEYVYEAIKRLPRFSSMRRGHQQDAEEFLGFLLEGLHDECVQVLRNVPGSANQGGSHAPSSPDKSSENAENGWLEVGPKQKAAVTRSSGTIVTESPITKIFGGKLRSELRVPGLKNSVTLEPYQPLQLDIGSPDVHNITEALKGLTRSETLQGDFSSPRGPGTSATKQVFIETLPPVLILHLKRFQYDNTGGTQKIWKRVGYPLELEIPKEVFPPAKRGGIAVRGGLPRYRLIAVVYHHGKNATVGHYTVDVRRQEGKEWIRMDDTYIRRVKSEDVAEGGAEDDPRVLAAALENHKRDSSRGQNIFEQVGVENGENEDDDGGDEGWSQVNGGGVRSVSSSSTIQSGGGKKWSAVANGGSKSPSTAGKQTPREKASLKDNRVAYILFYEQIQGLN